MIRLFLMLFVAITAPAFAEQTVYPEFYTATYDVRYKGFKVGSLIFELRPAAEENTYIYESRPKPGLLARLVVSPKAVERTVLQIDEEGVRPLTWISEDGTAATEDDGNYTFDWTAQQVTGTIEDKAVALPTEPGLQDRLSMQVAILTALLRDEPPVIITMIDEDRIKHYSYERQGTAEIDAAGDTYQTILYASTRPGSSRLKRIYHAPELGYLPVRFENFKDGNLQTVMELVDVTLAAGALRAPAIPTSNPQN